MKILYVFFTSILFLIQSSFCQTNFENPRAVIIISKTSFTQHWGVVQMSAHGWGGVMNLSGIPYECLFVEDLSSGIDLSKYDLMIFSQCTYLTDKDYKVLLKTLSDYLSGGGNIIVDGLMGYFDQDTKERNYSELNKLLGIKYAGFYGDMDFRIKLKDNNHFISRNFNNGDYLTQHIAGGLNIQTFEYSGKVLAELTNEKESFPFLSIKDTSGSRIIIVNDFGTWSGVASIFRNVQPQVFFKNQIYPLLIESVYWCVYGAVEEPIPSLQLSNADLTAIIRLDADASGNLNAQIQTINYLVNISEETGVVPVYAWVSSTAASAGWQDIAPLGKKLETAGGQIATHSKFHNIDQEMNDKRWKEELDDAIREIEFNMADYGYDIGKVNCFINPGNTIHMSDYNQIAKRFGFYMTHGFEQDMPIGYGNFTWYNEDQRNFVVLENTPSPDYQWFYDPTWSYTTQQITAYEENIFDHLYDNIGRGVIFNQMWHDYSITSQQQYGQSRIINKNNLAMYDAIKAKFKNKDVYCPEPEDLRYKLCIMAQSNYSWSAEGNEINIKWDIGNVGLDSAGLFTGGMGIRINNTSKKISKVVINGTEHFAFKDDLIVLPNLTGTTADIKVTLSGPEEKKTRLTYISKRMTSIEGNGDEIQLDIIAKSKAKFTFHAPAGYVLINADGFNYSHVNPDELDGYVNSDRKIRLTKIKSNGFSISNCSLRILDYAENESGIVLRTESSKQTNQFEIRTSKKIDKILFEGKELKLSQEGSKYSATIEPFDGTKELTIKIK